MKHTICFGEVLVDLLSNKLSQNNNEHEAFTKFAGGAPANVSVAIAKLGGNAYFAGMLSTDSFGDFLHNALKEQGVEIDRKSIKIVNEPIREVGTYDASANLHKEVKQDFKFEVVGE